MDQRLKEDGYIVLRSFLDTRILSEIKNDVVAAFARQIKRHNIQEDNFEKGLIKLFQTDTETFKNTGKMVQNMPSLYSFMVCHSLLNLLEHKCGIKFPVVSTKPVCFFHNKNLAAEEIYYKTPPHQDYHSIRGSLNGVVVWASLCDVDESLGPLKLLPKSHLKGSQWVREDHNFGVCDVSENDMISVPVKLGDVIIFNQMLVHASGTNTHEDKIRWSINLRFNDFCDDYWEKSGYYSPYEYKSKPKTFEGPTAKDMEIALNATS